MTSVAPEWAEWTTCMEPRERPSRSRSDGSCTYTPGRQGRRGEDPDQMSSDQREREKEENEGNMAWHEQTRESQLGDWKEQNPQSGYNTSFFQHTPHHAILSPCHSSVRCRFPILTTRPRSLFLFTAARAALKSTNPRTGGPLR